MADSIDLEDFGLCRECARPFNTHHAIGCSRHDRVVKPPVRYSVQQVDDMKAKLSSQGACGKCVHYHEACNGMCGNTDHVDAIYRPAPRDTVSHWQVAFVLSGLAFFAAAVRWVFFGA